MRDLDDENTPLRPQFDLLLSEGVGPAVIEEFDCTATLVGYATTNNLLIAYERT